MAKAKTVKEEIAKTKEEKMGITISEPVVTGLPDDALVEHFGKLDETIFFVVYRPYKRNPTDYKVLIGGAKDLKEVKGVVVSGVHANSGDTYYETQKGIFFFPFFLSHRKATFDGSPIPYLYK